MRRLGASSGFSFAIFRHSHLGSVVDRLFLTSGISRIPMIPQSAVRLFLGLIFLSLGCSQVAAQVQSQPHTIQVLVAYHSLSGNTKIMAQSVAEGAQTVSGTRVLLHTVGEVTADLLFSSDALVVGSPVYWSNMSGEVKTFFDRWQFEFGVFPEFKMRNKVGAGFATGGQISSGKEVTMLTILAAMLGNQMIVVSGGGAFGASATTEGDSPGIDEVEKADARALGKRVAEVTWMVKRGRLAE
jgi:NAD(P)H dehydrogenase (quinone)